MIWNRANFAALAAIGERLLNWHLFINAAERPEILYRVAVAYHLAGDDPNARTRLNDLKAHDGHAKGTVRGKDVILSTSLADELAQPVPVASGSSSDSYETFGGDASRNHILAANTTPGAHLYSIPLSRPARLSIPAGGRGVNRVTRKTPRTAIPWVSCRWSIGASCSFRMASKRLRDVMLESGVPLPGWLQSHGPDHDGAYTLPGVSGSPRARINSRLP